MSNNIDFYENTDISYFKINNPLNALMPDYAPDYDENLRTLRILLAGSRLSLLAILI